MSNSKSVEESDKSFQGEGIAYANILGQERTSDGHGVKMVRDSIIRFETEGTGRQHTLQGALGHGKEFCLHFNINWNQLQSFSRSAAWSWQLIVVCWQYSQELGSKAFLDKGWAAPLHALLTQLTCSRAGLEPDLLSSNSVLAWSHHQEPGYKGIKVRGRKYCKVEGRMKDKIISLASDHFFVQDFFSPFTFLVSALWSKIE